MTKATVAANVHKALDIQSDLCSQTSLNLVLFLDYLTKYCKILAGKGVDVGIGIDVCFSQISTAENLPIP